jgi:hypothetical protein
MELLNLKQSRGVDEYRREFEHLVYHIRLYDASLSNTMLTTQFIMGLKEELKLPVEIQLPELVAKSPLLASIQEKLLDKNDRRQYKSFSAKKQLTSSKSDNKQDSSGNIIEHMVSISHVVINLPQVISVLMSLLQPLWLS